MAWIDSHVHVWTPDTRCYPLADGIDADSIRPRDFSPEVLLRHARPSNVDRAILVGTVIYGTDNSFALNTVRRFPSVFRLVAIIDHRVGRLEEIMATLADSGVVGFRIIARPGAEKDWLCDEGYESMFRAASLTGQAVCPMTFPAGLAELDRMCSKYPDTTVIIDHMARIGELGPANEDELTQLCALARHPHVYVKLSRFHSLGNKRPPHDELAPLIRNVVETFGAERTMWGSDSPLQVLRETYEDSISLVRDRLHFLSPTEREQILSGTAERIFFQS